MGEGGKRNKSEVKKKNTAKRVLGFGCASVHYNPFNSMVHVCMCVCGLVSFADCF